MRSLASMRDMDSYYEKAAELIHSGIDDHQCRAGR
jgi:hypothetical protein